MKRQQPPGSSGGFRRFSVARRGFVLLAVLVIVGSALLVVTGLIYFAQSEAAARHVSRERAQQSVMVHSALNLIVPRLDRQRDRILDGELPELDEQYELHENGARLAVVRLLPLREGGPILEPESGKLDLNAVDAEQLAATGVFDASVAERIVRFREQTLGRPFQSVAELLHIEGVTVEMVYGPLAEVRVGSGMTGTDDPGFPPIGRLPRLREVNAVDVLTVFAFEPALQRDGRRRINLNVEWSSELAGRIDERFGEGASQIIKGIIDSGVAFDDESVIYTVLNEFDVPLEDWPDIVDAITTEDGEYHFSRLDINTASEAALRALPTVEPEQASEIVQYREGMSSDERATIAWPALNEILSREQYEQLGRMMTTRSWTYRIRFAVGEVDGDEPNGPMEGAMICEAVIDLSAPKPRVAYLRDITMLELAARIVVQDGLIDDGERETSDELLNAVTDDVDDPTDDDMLNDWLDDDGEVGAMEPIGDPAAGAEPGPAGDDPNGSPTRRRIGRWRGG